MNPFKVNMKIEEIVELFRFFRSIGGEKFFHFRRNIFRRCRGDSADLVRKAFIVAYGEPVLISISRSSFEDRVERFDEFNGKRFRRFVDITVNTAEMIYGFDDVIKPSRIRPSRDGSWFVDETSLLAGLVS